MKDLFYINDGIDPFGKYTLFGKGGLGYNPYLNIKGGSIFDGKYIGLDKTELDKLDENELRKIIDENNQFFKLVGDDESKLNDEQTWTYKQILKENMYIEDKLDNIERKDLINEVKNEIEEEIDDDAYFESDDFKEQMKYYEDNYDKLTDDEIEVYYETLATLHEYLGQGKEKKPTTIEKKMFNVLRDIEMRQGKELSSYHFEDESNLYDELKPNDIENMIKNIKSNEGYGKRFEKIIINIQDKVKKALTKDKSLISNNDNINRYKNKMVYFPKSKDVNGKVLEWEEKPLSEFLVYDLSQDKNDIELKYYNIGTYKPSENEIKKNGLILQQSKFINLNFIPLYTTDDNGKTKLYNIWSTKTNDWVNDKFYKDTYVLYQTSSGNYSYHLNDDKDLQKIDYPKMKGINNEKLYILQPIYKDGFDNHGKKIFNIPYNKLKKIHL